MNEQRDAEIEAQYDAFMKDVMNENYDGDFAEYGFKQLTPEIELTFTDISDETTTFTTEISVPVNAIIEKIDEIIQKSYYGVDLYKGKGKWFNPYAILIDVDNSIVPHRADLVAYLGASLENAISYDCAEFFLRA